MRIILHPLVVFFLFSLPWRLNSHLTPGSNITWNQEHLTDHQRLTQSEGGPSGLRDHSTENAHQRLTQTEGGPLGLRDYSSEDGKENVVSLSRSIQMQHYPRSNDSEQRGAQVRTSSSEVLNQRGKRNTDDNGQNPALAETKIQMEVTTANKELKPKESSLTSQAILKNTEFAFSTHPPISLGIDSLQEENKTHKTTQETPATSDSTVLYDTQTNRTDMDANKTNTNSDLHTIQPTLDTTVQPGPKTHTPTSTVTLATDFNRTENMKTTKREEIVHKQTDYSEPETSSMIKPVESTTLKTTTTRVVHSPKNKQKSNPGPAVASVIGTTFAIMFIVIIVIFVRKRKMQKKQLENREWAGPSPFLDGDVQPNLPSMLESESVNRRGFSQISISRYLPHRLSKHLTLRRDTNEEVFMGDILQGSTFGRQNLEEDQAPKREPTLGQGKTEENQNHQGPASVDSEDTKTPEVTVDIQESSIQNEDLTASLSQDSVIKPLTHLVSIDLDSLSEETAPSQTSNVGNIPPAPPLA